MIPELPEFDNPLEVIAASGVHPGNLVASGYPFGEPLQVRCWRAFQYFLDSPGCKRFIDQLSEDERVSALDNSLICNGIGGRSFNLSELVQWYLWIWSLRGKNVATTALEQFLNDDERTIQCVIGVEGPLVDENIDLLANFRLANHSALPECELKESVSRSSLSAHLGHTSRPTAFLIGETRVPKIWTENYSSSHQFRKLIEWYDVGTDLCLLLNCLPEAIAVPAYHYSVPINETPFGPASGPGGGGISRYQRAVRRQVKLSEVSPADVASLWNELKAKTEKERNRWRHCLSRLAAAKAADNWSDAALELGIALEMMLLGGSNTEQLSLTFRLRGSWALEPDDAVARATVFSKLKDIYTFRSEVAHTGLLTAKSETRLKNDGREYFQIAERIARRLLLNDVSDWDSVILALES